MRIALPLAIPTCRRRDLLLAVAALLLTGAVAMLSGCATAPALSPQDAYLQTRQAYVDPKQPCFIDPFDPFPVKVINHRILVAVAINGVETAGILDTGASFSLITPELAAKASVTVLKSGERLSGIAGSFATGVGVANEVRFGSVKSLNRKRIHILPFGGSHGLIIGAQIGMDWLDGLDYDFDVNRETITPYRVGNCATIDPPWRDDYTGVILKRDFESHGNHSFLAALYNRQITLPVAFPNGNAIEATFDTGSTDSLLSHDAAIDAGVTRDQISADPVIASIAIDGRPKELHRHRFGKLSIGEEDLHDVSMFVEPHFDRRSTPMLLGMDYIGKHRFWISFSTNAIYIDSGKPKPPEPPFDEPRQIAGARMPEYPAGANGRKGLVHAACTVEADGSLTACSATLTAGPDAYRLSVLRWLASPFGPLMQPAYVNHAPIRKAHVWDIAFDGK